MTKLTHLSFQESVRVNRFAAIHFWATWNGYDAEMKELLQSQIPAELADLIAFGTFDTDPAEHRDICRKHKVRNLPFIPRRLIVHALTGMRKPDEIVACLRELASEDV